MASLRLSYELSVLKIFEK